jgi:transcription initiation factor IIE alpha subunit
MARKQKYTDQFILEVLTARNEQKLTHKELKKKFKLSQNQLSYILYSFKEKHPSLTLWERIKRWFS